MPIPAKIPAIVENLRIRAPKVANDMTKPTESIAN